MDLKLLKFIIYIFAIALTIVCLFYFKVIVKLLLLSVVIAYMLYPLVMMLSKKGVNKRVAALILITITTLATLFLMFIVIPGMMVDLLQSVSSIKSFDTEIEKFFGFLHNKNTSPFVKEIIENSIARLGKSGILLINNSIKQLVSFCMVMPTYILAPIFVYYFLVDPGWFLNFITRFIPNKIRSKTLELIGEIDEIVGGFIKSQIILSLVVSLLTYIVLIVMKVKYPFIIAVINGIANIIPYFGPIIGIVPAVFAALSDSISKAVLLTIILLVIQQVESSIISPKLVGDSIDMHPVFVMLVLLIGGELFGFWGLIFSIPVGGAARVTWKYICRNLF
jgi:predicted PurR-regulated permease PerM